MFKNIFNSDDDKYTRTESMLRADFYGATNSSYLKEETKEYVPRFASDTYHHNVLFQKMDDTFNNAISGFKVNTTIQELNRKVITLFEEKCEIDTQRNESFKKRVNTIPKPMMRPT